MRYSCAIDQFNAKPSEIHRGTLLFANIPLLCASGYPIFSKKHKFAYGRLPQVVRIRATVLPSIHQLQMYNQHTCYLQTRHPPIPPESQQTPERRATYGNRWRLRKATPGRQVLQKLRRSRHRQTPYDTPALRAVPFQFSTSPCSSRFPIRQLPPNPNQEPRMLSVHRTSPDLSHQQQLILLLLLLLLRSPRLGRRIITIIIIIIPPYSPGAAAAMGDAWWKECETSVALAVATFAALESVELGRSGVSLSVFSRRPFFASSLPNSFSLPFHHPGPWWAPRASTAWTDTWTNGSILVVEMMDSHVDERTDGRTSPSWWWWIDMETKWKIKTDNNVAMW